MKKPQRVAVVATVDKDMDFTPPAQRVYARQVDVSTDHSKVWAIEAGSNRPDVVLFGGHVDPTAAERKIRATWPEQGDGATVRSAAPASLNMDGVYCTLAQLEVFAESLTAMIAELRKWEKR